MADVVDDFVTSGDDGQGDSFSSDINVDYTTMTANGHFDFTTSNQSYSYTQIDYSYIFHQQNGQTYYLFNTKNSEDIANQYIFTYPGFSINYGNIHPSSLQLVFSNGMTGLSENVAVCFATGTLIRIARDRAEVDVAVEALTVGDVAVTSSGEYRPIRWIGRRTVECARHPQPEIVLPVRIAAHAFASERPARDLVVSPGHALAVDLLGEVLIPASALVNGATIRQDNVERVTYWHVELDSHDLLIAENLPAESYLEMGNRTFFAGATTALHATSDAPTITHADFCRPFHADGLVVAFVRDRLVTRALELDWTRVESPLADLHLVVDGRRVEPEVRDLSARFLVSATAEIVELVSTVVVPAKDGGGADPRPLGVCVGKLVVDDGFGSQVIMADDPRLSAGFHHIEEGPQRWTAGRARLPAELWEGCRGSFFLRVDLTRPALPRWERHASALKEVA